MKIAKLAIGVALIGCIMVGATRAQSVQGQGSAVEPAYGYAVADSTSGQQSAVQPTAYGYVEVEDEMVAPPIPAAISPSNAAPGGNWSDYGSNSAGGSYASGSCASGSCASGSCASGSCASCGGAGCGACMECCPLDEPIHFFDQIVGRDTGLDVGGWISVGGLGNEYRATLNGPLGFNTLGDGVNVHQAWFYAGKETKTDGCGWDVGGRVDYIYGVDGPDTQAFRGTQWDIGWTSGDYGSAIPQAYAEIAIDYLTVKAGYFYTLIGYEVVQAPQNFFFSHSYTQYYIEPFTHTGAVATYDGFENFTFYGGWTAGWDTAFEKVGDSNMFLGGVTYSPNDDLSVTYMTSTGRLDDLTAGEGDVYMHSIVMDLHLTNRLDWVIQSDLHYRDGRRSNVAAGGVNQYLFYKVNDCWSIGGRFEWLYDRDGAFVQPGLAAGNYYNLTGGVNWKPHTNVIIRPEVRYDWFSGTFRPGGLPFDNATADDQFSLGFDVILLY